MAGKLGTLELYCQFLKFLQIFEHECLCYFAQKRENSQSWAIDRGVGSR